MNNIFDKLKKFKEEFLHHLFDNDDELDSDDEEMNDYKKFINNLDITITIKWTYILYHPFYQRKLINKMCKKEDILNVVIKSLNDAKCRCVNPILLIIFYEELNENILNYNLLESEENLQFSFTKSGKKVRSQINNTFQLYWNIINNKKINELKNIFINSNNADGIDGINIMNYIFYNFGVERKIEEITVFDNYDNRYIDAFFNFGKFKKNEYSNEVYIEFNEDSHHINADKERLLHIFSVVRKIPIEHFCSQDNISNTVNKVLIQFAKIIYSLNNKIGMLFYLSVIYSFNIDYAKFFIDTINGIKLNDLMNNLKNFGFTKKQSKKEFLELVKNELDDEDFKEYNDENFLESELNSYGLDCVIMILNKTHFLKSKELKSCYSKFKEIAFDKMKDDFKESDDEIKYKYLLMDCVKKIKNKEYINYLKFLNTYIINKINKNKVYLEKKFKVSFNQYLPILIKKTKYENDMQDINKSWLKNILSNEYDNIIDNKIDDAEKPKIVSYKFITKNIFDELFT
jgi:hypothetical protein